MRDSLLPLTVHVDAEEWGYAQRRMTYLSAMIARILRDECGLQEWFTAAQLASLKLPGLPATKSGIAQKAARGKWPARRDGPQGYRYHVASLPGRAFDALVSRVIDMPEVEADILPMPDLRPGPEPVHSMPPSNTAPPWVLPLMRLMKGKAAGDLGKAWSELPNHVPAGVALPTVEEAAAVLVSLGIAGR